MPDDFFADMDASNEWHDKQRQKNPAMLYDISVKSVQNTLFVELTIDDYKSVKTPCAYKTSLDKYIQKQIEQMVENIADYNNRVLKNIH